MIIKTKDGFKKLGKPIDFSKFTNVEYKETELDDEQKRTLMKDMYGTGEMDSGDSANW